MSFKDVRDLGEHLKLLGFPNVFPLQSLATSLGSLASFQIVAEILQWLAGLLEPGASLPGSVQSEEERILLIRSATEFFVTKSAIKLNPRKLYAASSVTAAELQKITRLLIAPSQNDQDKEDEENYRSLNQVDIGDKMDDLRRARELSSDMTQRGAALHDLLAKELVNKETRLMQANRPMELASVERTMKNAIAAAQVKLQASRAQLENGRVELNALNSKLQRKRGELERTKQRLDALQKIRPAHMQEFEECEKELQDLFQKYFLRIHVRDSLRAQFEARTKRATPISSPISQKPNESSMPFIPEGLIEDDFDDGEEEPQLNGAGIGVLGSKRSKFGLDAEIPDIRDEDLLLRQTRGYADGKSAVVGGGVPMSGKRAGSTTNSSRIRPTTGRSRKNLSGAARGKTRERRVPAGGLGSSRAVGGAASLVNGLLDDDDDSSFGSSESDLDMDGIMGMSGSSGVNALGAAGMGGGIGGGGGGGGVGGLLSGLGMSTDLSGMGDDDDDFDLNSIEDISISKITGELPIRPKTAKKEEHHSDEDF